ncbi:MAG TPA: hypothetical protein VER76_07430, partial [Pyrinomonadaceae bacterium]|nr:hypothetical protein [Pyrinomonadaceae bacterium]
MPKHAPVNEPTIGAHGEGDEREIIDERERWFMMQRAYPFDKPPADGRLRAYLSRPKDAGRGKDGSSAYSLAQTWRSIGPSPTTPAFPSNWGMTSGRINSIAIHPTNPQIVLVGAATGGIWRSTNGGANYVPVSDGQVDLAVGSIAFAKSNPSIVYAGMGDLGNGYFGTGVLKSTDAGATWTRISNDSLPPLGTTSKIEVDPTDANRVYVLQATHTLTTSYDKVNADGNRYASGVFVSTDGGIKWVKTLFGSPRDLAIDPETRTIYVGMNPVTIVTPAGVPPVVEPATLQKSEDGGLTWTPLFVSPTGTNTTDMRVAVSRKRPDSVYLLSGNRSNIRLDIIDRLTGLATTKNLKGVDPGQFGYNSYLHVNPDDANVIYIGTRDLYVSGDGGNSWSNLTRNFIYRAAQNDYPYCPEIDPPYEPCRTINSGGAKSHPDQHAFAFHPTNPNVIYIGNDGGVSLSSDGGSKFESLNASLTLTQFVGISMHPTDASISYGGTQDNGTQRRVEGTSTWKEFSSGDGGNSIVNPVDPSMVFTTYVRGTINRFRNNGLTHERSIGDSSNSSVVVFKDSVSGARDRIGFYPPFKGNQVDSTLYFGTHRLWISTNTGDSWSSPGEGADLTKGITLQGSDVLSAIGVSRAAYSVSQIIYTGSAQGRVMVTQDGGANWSDITAGLPNRFVESITVNPANAAEAYVTFGGFGSGHVFRTTNSGASWTDIGGSPGQPNAIPNVPVSAFLIDPKTPSTLYAGTDIGVFRSTDNGATWATFNQGMLPAVVTGFATSANGTIQLSTDGRGAYELVTQPNYTVSGRVTLFEGGAGLGGVTVRLANGQPSPPTAI